MRPVVGWNSGKVRSRVGRQGKGPAGLRWLECPEVCRLLVFGRRVSQKWVAALPGFWDMRRPLANTTDSILCKSLEVQVGDKGIERAIKHLKRKMAAEGILRELKRRRHYMKPSVKRRKKASEAARRRRKRLRTGPE